MLLGMEMTCLRKIRRAKRMDRIRNEVIRSTLHVTQRIIERTEQRQLKRFGHVRRVSAERFPAKAMAINARVRTEK